MSITYNTTPVNRGLLFSCDFANPKVYSRLENLIPVSENLTDAYWGQSTTNIISSSESDPIGTTTARVVQARPIQYGGFIRTQAILYGQNTTYTMSVYAKAGTWNYIGLRPSSDAVSVGGDIYTYFNLSTGVSVNLANPRNGGVTVASGMIPVGNGWYRCWVTFTTGTGGFGVTDFCIVGDNGSSQGTISSYSRFAGTETVQMWGLMLERNRSVGTYIKTTGTASIASVITEPISGLIGSLNKPEYYAYDSLTNSMNFNRTDVTVDGGWAQFNTSGNLSANTYLYNDHTTEVFFRPNTVSGTALPNNTENALIVFQGYHAGFIYAFSSPNAYVYYAIWNGLGYNIVFIPNNLISNGTWCHIVATRSGNTITIYFNGQQVTSQTISSGAGNPGTGNVLKIGAGNTTNDPFAWFTKMNVSIARMYNTALTASEVLQNFNAFRGRGGI